MVNPFDEDSDVGRLYADWSENPRILDAHSVDFVEEAGSCGRFELTIPAQNARYGATLREFVASVDANVKDRLEAAAREGHPWL